MGVPKAFVEFFFVNFHPVSVNGCLVSLSLLDIFITEAEVAKLLPLEPQILEIQVELVPLLLWEPSEHFINKLIVFPDGVFGHLQRVVELLYFNLLLRLVKHIY